MADHEIICIQKTDRTEVHERIRTIGGIDPTERAGPGVYRGVPK